MGLMVMSTKHSDAPKIGLFVREKEESGFLFHVWWKEIPRDPLTDFCSVDSFRSFKSNIFLPHCQIYGAQTHKNAARLFFYVS